MRPSIVLIDAVLVVAALAVASGAVTPALAQCDGMESMPDGNWEFNPKLCPNGPPRGPTVSQIWTAIAVSKSAPVRTATSWQARSQAAAEKAALDLCDQKTPDCSIAIAASPNGAWGTGDDLGYIGADHAALANCTAYGGTNCTVKVDPCADDQKAPQGYTAYQP